MSTSDRPGGARSLPTGRGHDYRLVPAAVTVWLSALLGLLGKWWAGLACGVVATVVAVALAWRGMRGVRDGVAARRRWSTAGALLACGVLAAGPLSLRLFLAEHDPLREAARRGSAAVLDVTVAQRPQPLRTVGYAGRPSGTRSVLVPVTVRRAVVAGRPVPSTGRAVLIAPAPKWSWLLPGQKVTARGELAPARPNDMTAAAIYVRGPPEHVGPAAWWQRSAADVRAALRDTCAVLADEPAGLLPGLVVGDTSGLAPRVEQEFRDAGLSHVTAVSGSNLAIVCGAVLLLARALRLGPRVSAVAAGVALAAFVTVVGYEPSVLRAAVMGAVGLLALVLGRERSALPALAVAVCALVLYDPAMATRLGFALSVVATAGLVLLAPRWAGALARRGVPMPLAQGLAVPVTAFLVTAPAVAGTVGEVSPVSIAANLLAAPVVAPVTVLGALATVLAVPWPPVAELAVHAAGPGVSWLILVARAAAGVPGAVLPWPPGWWGGLLATLVVVLLMLALRYRQARTALGVALVGVLAVLVPVRFVAPSWPPDDWALVACDVGQGDGIVLATAERGRAVVVDTGPDPAVLGRCLDRLDVDRVPLVVLTHLHADHIGGLAAVFDGRAVGAIAVGPGRSPRWAWREVVSEARDRQVPLVELGMGDSLRWPGLRIDVLGPRSAHLGAAGDDGTDVNDSSVVLRAGTRAGRVLLTGDIELAAQADLLGSGADMRAEIVKVPHHGSRFTLPPFLAAVSPRIALVSVGADNTYGHPSPTILRVLTRHGVLVARTDIGGDTAVIADGGEPAVVRRGPGR